MSQKIVVGMSGGVDSSVTALLLLEQGYEVIGLFMKNWEEDDHTGLCTAPQDFADAQAVCDKLGIPLHAVNFAAEYWDEVFEVFLSEYRAARTPNPDILCNQQIKFKAFMDYATDLGADLIATGHYARVGRRDDGYALLKGIDKQKDQSYFIYTLGQSQLARVLFPIGSMEKSEVRKRAEQAGLSNHQKKDSTGICFIGERRFKEFLQRFLPAQPGEIQMPDGQIIGRHDGLMYYTLGQRQGLGIGGMKGASEEPWYVVAKDLERNVLVVGQGHDHPMLFHTGLEAGNLSWVHGKAPDTAVRCSAKIRYRQPNQSCTVEAFDEQRIRVVFDQAQRAVTPGQSVVFYQDEECLGGGIIERALNAAPGSTSAFQAVA